MVSSYGNYGSCAEALYFLHVFRNTEHALTVDVRVFKVVLGILAEVRWSFYELTLNMRVFCGGFRYFWRKRGDGNSRMLSDRVTFTFGKLWKSSGFV